MTDSKKIQEGLELIRSAEKSLKTTFLKWRPDYEVAADEYSKAATCFKIGKSFEQCKDCYMKASECHKQNRSLFHAAKNLEQAILVCKDLGDLRDIPDLAHRACTYYQQQGSPDAAATALDKAAKILEPTQPDQALQLYKRAAEVVTIEDSPRQAAEYVSKIARILVKLRMYDEAADAIRREIGLHQQSESIAAMGRLTVALVLVQLARGDTVAAEKAFKEWGNCCDAPEPHLNCEDIADALTTEFLSGSIQGRSPYVCSVQTLESLLQAFDEEDPDDARQALNSSFIKHMDIEYARLARDLPLPQPTIPRAPAKDTAVRPNAAPTYVSPNQSKTQDAKGGEEGAGKEQDDDEEFSLC